jgi:hypothetical protein
MKKNEKKDTSTPVAAKDKLKHKASNTKLES